MTINTGWLKEVCGDPVLRPTLSEPRTFERDGERFTVATDGHRLVELPGNDGEFAPVPDSGMAMLLKIVAPAPDSAVLIDYPALKAFIAEEMKDVLRDCLECDSTGQIAYFTTRGTGPNYAPCPRCEGACLRAKLVYIGGVMFNARLWEPMLANLPEPPIVGWYQKSQRAMAIVDGVDWRFFVMPYNDSNIDSELRARYHRFEIPGAQAKAA